MCETIYILSGCAYIIFPACDCRRLAGNVTLTELATVERAILRAAAASLATSTTCFVTKK